MYPVDAPMGWCSSAGCASDRSGEFITPSYPGGRTTRLDGPTVRREAHRGRRQFPEGRVLGDVRADLFDRSVLSTHGLADSDRSTNSELRLQRVPELSEIPGIARQARKAWGLRPKTKLDLRRVCDRLDIEVSVVPMEVPDGGAQGFLIPKPVGFLIEVDPEPREGWQSVAPSLRRQLARHRERFLVAHELAHTLFYEESSTGPRRVVFNSTHQETFCDELARALLVPADASAELPFQPESVVEIQHRFDVSMEVALRSLVEAHREAGVAWLLVQGEAEMQIQWSSVEHRPTPRIVRALRSLASKAAREGCSRATLPAPGSRARAQYLPRRKQVIVTSRPSGNEPHGRLAPS
jgi:hypothetical protein